MNDQLTTSGRNTALDNLRAAAMLLGLITHGVLPYTATGLVVFPVRDHARHVAADVCYFALHNFRMQLFFLLAGFAAAALGARRGGGALVRNRLARVALPLALAVVTVCPLMNLLFESHAADRGVPWDPADGGGWVGPNFHLWFLYYLLLVCSPLVALLAVAGRIPARVVRAFDALARWCLTRRWKVPAAVLLAMPVLWGMPAWWVDTPKGWAPDPAVYAYYLGFFLVGAVLYRHADLLAGVGRRWPLYFAAANLLVLPAAVRLTVGGVWAEMEGELPPGFVWWKGAAVFLGGLYTWLMVASLIGLFQRHVAARGRRWKYLADASYWCYLAGFPVQVLLQTRLAPLDLPIVAKFLLVTVPTLAVLLASYELCVRHTWVGLMLTGKRPERTPPAKTAAVVIVARLPMPAAPVCVRGEDRPLAPRPMPAVADVA